MPSFRHYNLDEANPYEPSAIEPTGNITSVLKKFNPAFNSIDKRILYEISGAQIASDNASSHSSDGNDERSGLGEPGEVPNDFGENPN